MTRKGVKIVKNSELFKKCRNPVEKAFEDYQDSRTVPETCHTRWSQKALGVKYPADMALNVILKRQRQIKAKNSILIKEFA
jgi:hypothetical protein